MVPVSCRTAQKSGARDAHGLGTHRGLALVSYAEVEREITQTRGTSGVIHHISKTLSRALPICCPSGLTVLSPLKAEFPQSHGDLKCSTSWRQLQKTRDFRVGFLTSLASVLTAGPLQRGSQRCHGRVPPGRGHGAAPCVWLQISRTRQEFACPGPGSRIPWLPASLPAWQQFI